VGEADGASREAGDGASEDAHACHAAKSRSSGGSARFGDPALLGEVEASFPSGPASAALGLRLARQCRMPHTCLPLESRMITVTSSSLYS
jgi:hypothetical protein